MRTTLQSDADNLDNAIIDFSMKLERFARNLGGVNGHRLMLKSYEVINLRHLVREHMHPDDIASGA